MSWAIGDDGKVRSKHANDPISQDAVVEANRQLLLQRSNVGINKYGITLAESSLTRRQLLQHALEEALDLANYLQAEIMRHDGEYEAGLMAGCLVHDAEEGPQAV